METVFTALLFWWDPLFPRFGNVQSSWAQTDLHLHDGKTSLHRSDWLFGGDQPSTPDLTHQIRKFSYRRPGFYQKGILYDVIVMELRG